MHRKILVITLSNIGDAILTTPVVQALRKNFPDAAIDILAGPRAAEVFKGDPRVHKTIVYDKHQSLAEKIKLIKRLRENHYHTAIDLRNTLIPLLIGVKHRTPLFFRKPRGVFYKKDAHLFRLKQAGVDIAGAELDIWISAQDQLYIDSLLADTGKNFIAVAPGARSDTKRWSEEKFTSLCEKFTRLNIPLALTGDGADEKIAQFIVERINSAKILNLCGRTTLAQLAALLKRSKVLISNDSAVMHIAAAVKTPVVAIFGPTNPGKYAPRGEKDIIIRKDIPCSPCERAQCQRTHQCLEKIGVEEVYNAAKKIYENTCN
ncbi:MAG: glycosyltransferase family 9 protein [Candidatus Omnitrophota bacterium]